MAGRPHPSKLFSVSGAGTALFQHALSQNRLPQASRFSKPGHSCCLHQEISRTFISALCGSLTTTGPGSPYA